MKNNKGISPSEAAAALGRISTPRKAAAARANSARSRFQEKPLSELPCTCGQCPDHPKTTCPRGRAIRRRYKFDAATGKYDLTARREPQANP